MEDPRTIEQSFFRLMLVAFGSLLRIGSLRLLPTTFSRERLLSETVVAGLFRMSSSRSSFVGSSALEVVHLLS
jgi:hypothetical protein